jgi:hypothetical protein
MAHLGITKIGDAELEALDALNDHLQAGKGMGTFTHTPEARVEIVPRESAKLDRRPAALAGTQPNDPEPTSFEALEKIYQFLDKACEREWHLPTSVIQGLTGARPKGTYWKRYGFEFTPATKHGLETAWAVRKASWDFTIR